MAKILTQAAIDALLRRPPDKRREIPDAKAAGLHLILQASGASSWALRYRFQGKSRKLTLGPYPALGLAAARDRAAKARASLADGVDPGALKKAAKAAAQEVSKSTLDLVETVVEAFVKRYAMK